MCSSTPSPDSRSASSPANSLPKKCATNHNKSSSCTDSSCSSSNSISTTSANCSSSIATLQPPDTSLTPTAPIIPLSSTKNDLSSTYAEFIKALHSVEPFDHWYWIRRLITSTLQYLYDKVQSFLWKDEQKLSFRQRLLRLRPIVPILAMGIVVIVIVTYFYKLHGFLTVKHQWCSSSLTHRQRQFDSSCTNDNSTCSIENEDLSMLGGGCGWSRFHAGVVVYLGVMILWNYKRTVFGSPGLALPASTTGGVNSNDGGAAGKTTIQYKSVDGRGGCFFFPPAPINIEQERNRVNAFSDQSKHILKLMQQRQEHRNSSSSEKEQQKKITCYPSPEASYCDKCDIMRPPRCRHCKACNRCVLQMDHHCPWMNNCIGHSNYRTFLITILYINIGCWYGVYMLWGSFREIVVSFIETYGFWHIYTLFRAPLLWTMLRQMLFSRDGLEMETVIRILFLFLVAVGVTMAVFVYSHLKMILGVETTLEQIIRRNREKESALMAMAAKKNKIVEGNNVIGAVATQVDQTGKDDKDDACVINPFDQGWKRNFRQVFGNNLCLIFLPVVVEAPYPSFDNETRPARA